MDSEAEFFVLLRGEFDSQHDTEMLEDDPVHLGEAPRCDLCGRFVGGRRWLAPHRAELTLHGSSWGDFAFRGAVGGDFLMAENVAERFQEAGLRGLSGFEHVEITKVRGSSEKPPAYLHAAIEISTTRIDERGSVIERSEATSCDRCHYGGTLDAIRGFSVASQTWAGEDLFIAMQLPGTAIASARFKAWAVEETLTNIRFVPTTSFEWDSLASASSSR